MAIIGYRENANELEALYKKNITPSDRFNVSRIRFKKTIFSKKALQKITSRSVMPDAKQFWNSFPQSERDYWKNKYSDFYRSGWSAFFKAMCDRRKGGSDGLPVANDYYLGEVGKILIESPANRCHIRQDHPHSYFVMKKKKGTKEQYDPVLIQERAFYPIIFKLSYFSNLTFLDNTSYARVYVRTRSHYQSRDLYIDQVFDLINDRSWKRINESLKKPFGDFMGYEVHIDLYNVTGVVLLDGLVVKHSGKNWARDPQFNNMRTTFTKKYFQVAQHWDIVDMPNGASFDSVYYE